MTLFDYVKQKLSILDVVGEYTSLKKAGVYWKSCCPLHHEKTPSFTVSPHKEIFYCFGCHATGDVISFIEKIEHCSPIDAVNHLIERYSIDVPKEHFEKKSGVSQSEKKNYTAVCTFLANWAHNNMLKSQEALNYLNNRNITKELVNDFEIGYFPANGIKNLLSAAQKESIMAQDFIEAKILIEGAKGLFSNFEERILFPIKDHLGKTCGFGGRVFQPNDDRAKYYNSHEHLYFNKSSILYGLDRSKKFIQDIGSAFLVEGYTDLISMVQHGYKNTVATLGTACTQDHLKQLSRYAHTLYVLYDGDEAGQKAIQRLTELCWSVNLDLFVINLPIEDDPASYLNKHKNIDILVKQAKDIFTFFIETLSKDFHKQPLQERLALTKKLVDTIKNIEDPIKRDILLQKCSEACQIPVETLQGLRRPAQMARQASTYAKASADKHQETPDLPLLEKKLLSVIIDKKLELNEDDKTWLKKWMAKPLRPILSKVFDCNILSEEEKQLVNKCIIEAEVENDSIDKQSFLKEFYKKQWKLIIRNVRIKIDEAQKKGDEEKVNMILNEVSILKKKMLSRGII